MIDGTHLLGFNREEFIHHVVNNSEVIFFFWNFFLGMGLLPQSFAGCAAA